MSSLAILLLLPQLVMLMLARDIPALLNILATLVGFILAELTAVIPERRNTFDDGTVLFAGILCGLLLPATLNPIVAFLSAFSGFFIARIVFGGLGSSWINPVAVSVCIAYISQSKAFPLPLVSADGIRMAGDAFGALKLDSFKLISGDQSLADILNSGIFSLFDMHMPEGYVTLFWNSPSVIPAFRYNVLTLAASIILIAHNAIDWIVPSLFLLSYAVCVYFFSLVPLGIGPAGGNILFSLLTSGILFIAFFVLPDYSTTPRSRTGKVISGLLAGIMAFLLCGPGGSPIGGMFTVISINTVNPLIEYVENRIIGTGEDIA
jgi:electron transport complex protein RnfD